MQRAPGGPPVPGLPQGPAAPAPRLRRPAPERSRRSGATREASVTTGWRRRGLLFVALALLAPVAGVRLAAQDSTGVVAPPAAPPAADSATPAPRRAGAARSRRRGHSTARSWSTGSWPSSATARSSRHRWTRRSSRGSRRASLSRRIPTRLAALRKQIVAVDRRRGAAGPAGAARHRHQGHRPGDRRRRRAAGAEGPGQLHLGSRLQERAQAGRVRDARGVPALADRPAARGRRSRTG